MRLRYELSSSFSNPQLTIVSLAPSKDISLLFGAPLLNHTIKELLVVLVSFDRKRVRFIKRSLAFSLIIISLGGLRTPSISCVHGSFYIV